MPPTKLYKNTTGRSQTWLVKKAQKILEQSETVLLNCLEGKTKGVTERLKIQVALEIYKRRIPIDTEKAATNTNSVTMIKVVKNHIPGQADSEVIDTKDSHNRTASDPQQRIESEIEKLIDTSRDPREPRKDPFWASMDEPPCELPSKPLTLRDDEET